MVETIPGSAQLRARTILHNPRYIHGLSRYIIFDANIRGVWGHENAMLCSLRCNLRFPAETIPTGVYDIVAKIVNFERNVHLPNLEHDIDNFHLLGDILHIIPVPINFHRPLSTTPPTLSITCRLGCVHTEIDTFALSLSQVVQDASSDAHVNVCALLLHPAWLPIPLLFPNAIATISGSVLTFRNHVFFILVDNITRFPRTPQNHDAEDAGETSWWETID